MLKFYPLNQFLVTRKMWHNLGETAKWCQPCTAWFWSPLGLSPFPNIRGMILDSGENFWSFPSSSILSVLCLPLKDAQQQDFIDH